MATNPDTAQREDVIVDAPWQVVPGRKEIPVLLYLPEVHWQSNNKNSGIRIMFFTLEEVDEQRKVRQVIYDQLTLAPIPPKKLAGVQVEDEEGNILDWPVQPGESTYVNRKRELYKQYGLLVPNEIPDKKIREQVIREAGWHRILLIPSEHFKDQEKVVLRVSVTYVPIDFLGNPKHVHDNPGENFYKLTKVLEVRLPKENLPRFNAKDRYYDMHTHTMSEFTSIQTLLGARKNFGGPWRMIERAAYAIGMTDTAERARLKDRIVTTDHNAFLADKDMPEAGVFHDHASESAKKRPGGSPVDKEWELLRKYFGSTAGQEVSLHKEPGKVAMVAQGLDKASTFLDSVLDHWLWNVAEIFAPAKTDEKKKIVLALRRVLSEIRLEMSLAAHTLVYEHDERFLGPWYGGLRADVQRLHVALGGKEYEQIRHVVEIFIKALVGDAEDNPNKIWFLMNELVRKGGYTFGAHPEHGTGHDHERLNWTDEMFQIGMNFDDRARTRVPFEKDGEKYALVGEKSFPVKGFQWWNAPEKRLAAGLKPEDFYDLDPFRGSKRFGPNRRWQEEFVRGLQKWMTLIRQGLRYSFKEEPKKIFLRKVYMVAGTDAHGDFNYSSDLGATIADVWLSNQVSDMAFGRARTYVAEGARVETGDVVCTDGPLMKWSLDSELRIVDTGKSIDWRGSWEKVEWRDRKWVVVKKDGKTVPLDAAAFQSDGRMGGDGVFDGGRTMLAASGARSVLHNQWMNSAEFGGALQEIQWNSDANFVPVPVNVLKQASPPDRPAEGEEYSLIPNELAVSQANGVYYLWGSTKKDIYDVDGFRCFTNPIWVSPVTIAVQAKPGGGQNQGEQAAADLAIHFDFQISMSGGSVEAKRVNKDDESEGDPISLPGIWYSRKDADLSQFRASVQPLVGKGHTRWFVYMKDPKDTHGNVLNVVGTVIDLSLPDQVVQKPVQPPGNDPKIKPLPDPNRAGKDPGKNVLDRMKDRRAQDLDTLRKLKDEILVVRGDFDHVERVLDSLGIKHDLVGVNDLRKMDLAVYTAVFINCFGKPVSATGKDPAEPKDISEEARKKLREYMEQGGYLFTSDWAIAFIEASLPGYIERLKKAGKQKHEEMTSKPVERDHPFLRDVFAAGQGGQAETVEWVMEKESLTYRIEAAKVKMLLSSDELHQKHGSPHVASTFEVKGAKKFPGVVLHIMGHFYQQGLGNQNDDEVAKMVQIIVNFLVEAKKARTSNQKK